MIDVEGERFRLAIPMHDAVFFAMGWSDLGYDAPAEALRQVVGLIAIDALEYDEKWRAAALLRLCLRERWPEWSR